MKTHTFLMRFLFRFFLLTFLTALWFQGRSQTHILPLCAAPVNTCDNYVCYGDFSGLDNPNLVIEGHTAWQMSPVQPSISKFRMTGFAANSPDLFLQTGANATIQVSTGLTSKPVPNCTTIPNPTPGNPPANGGIGDYYMGILPGEAFCLPFSTPLVPNSTYILEFKAQSYLIHCGLPELEFILSPTEPCRYSTGTPGTPNWDDCNSFNLSNSQIIQAPAQPNAGTWATYTQVFTTGPGTAHNNVVVRGPVNGYGFWLLDDIAIRKASTGAVSVVSAVSNANPCVGDQVTITYTLTNNSINTITDAIQLQLNAGGNALSAPFSPTGHLTIPPNTIGPLGTTTIQASFIVGATGQFQATLNGWYPGNCLYINPAQDLITVQPGQNYLTITKSVVTPGPYHPGDLVQYEVRIGFPANANAPSGIHQVVMEDVLPAGVTNTGNVSANLVANSSPTVLLSTPQSITNGGPELVYTYEVAIGSGFKACQNLQNCASIINASALCGTPTYCELIYVEEANPVTLGFIPPVYTSCPGVCDATVTVPVLGGVGPFDLGIHTVSLSAPCPVGYSAISNVFSGLGPGLHEITVQDQGSFCNYFFTLEVFDAPPIVWGALSVVSNVSCPGGSDGSITVGASGGTGSLTFTWSNGATGPTATGLSAGSYDVTVTDDNGCSDVQTLQITEPGPITWSEQITNPVTCHAACDGEVTIANIQGGTPPYTVWFDNVAQPVGQVVFPGLCEGIYNVNIEDANGCLSPYPVSLVLPNSAPATWHKTTENNFGDDMGDDIVVDDDENVYVTGTFHEWTNFPDQFNPNTIGIWPGNNGMFVAKYDRCGDLQWVRIGYFNGNPIAITGSVTGTGVTVDHSNNRVYVTGDYETLGSGNLVFITGTAIPITGPSSGIYIAEYDLVTGMQTNLWSSGPSIFLPGLATSADYVHANAITDNDAGQLFICGYTGHTSAGPGADYSFLQKFSNFSSTTTPVATVLPDRLNNQALDVQADQAGNIYMVGKTLNAISFDATIGYPPSFAGGPSGYVARFVNQPVAMQHTWLRGITSDGSEPALKGVALDNSGGPVVVGSFGENYLNDPFSAPMPGLTLPGNHTVVARLDVAGNLQWMNRTTGTDDSGEDVAVAADKVWVTGDLHGGMLTYLQSGWGGAAAGNPQTSLFVNRLDLLSGLCETGALVDGSNSSVHEARGIAAGNAVFATGGYRGKMEMGIGNPATLQGAGSGATGSPRFAFTIRANTLSGQFNKVGVPEPSVPLEAGMTLFPNPARDVITLALSDDWKVEGTRVEVYDVSGKIYHTAAINALMHHLDLDGMPAGMYVVSVTNNATGLHETARFVKQ